jgi:hypothetical protein
MKRKSVLDSFKDKKFRYGGYAALIVAVVIVVIVVLNLLVDLLPWKADLTSEKFYSLSDQTTKVIDNLDDDVTIYGLAQPGRENLRIDEILRRYQTSSRLVTLEYIDPYRNPAFPKKYELEGRTPGENSLIVVSGDKFKVIEPFDMYNYSYNPDNPFESQPQSLKVEEVLTGAILYVTAKEDPVIYQLVGHQEFALPAQLSEQIEDENYAVKQLNLLVEEKVPDDATILLVLSPKFDLTEGEVAKLREFLFDRRGSGFFLLDIVLEEQPNLDGLLKSYGVEIKRALIYEGDAGRHIPQYSYGLVPEMPFHIITSSLRTNDLLVLAPLSQAIEELEIKRRTIEVEPLLTTSEKAWGKVQLESRVELKRPGDLDGPFDLAVAITDTGEREQGEARTVVTGSSFLLYPDRALGVPLQGPGNFDFFLNSLNWLRGQEELISIRPKSLFTTRLTQMSQLKLNLFFGLVMLIPVLAFVAGLVFWLRRRHL